MQSFKNEGVKMKDGLVFKCVPLQQRHQQMIYVSLVLS